MTDDYPPSDDARERTTDRQRDRAERVERLLDDFVARIEDRPYPVSSEELSATYAGRSTDLPDESVGDAIDRLDGEYDSPEAVREALRDELTGRAAGGEEDDPERPVEGPGDDVD